MAVDVRANLSHHKPTSITAPTIGSPPRDEQRTKKCVAFWFCDLRKSYSFGLLSVGP